MDSRFSIPIQLKLLLLLFNYFDIRKCNLYSTRGTNPSWKEEEEQREISVIRSELNDVEASLELL